MNNIINYNNLRNFAYSNDKICKKPIKGIVLTLNGLGFADTLSDDNEVSRFFAGKGIVNIIPYYNPWCWMNRQSVDFVDEIIAVIFKQYMLSDNIPVVVSGESMGGLCAVVYTAYAKITPVACVVNCPVCDLPYHFTERPDLPRTLYSAFGNYECSFEAALQSASPVHLISVLPDINYCVFHCEQDKAVNKQRHSDIFVDAMRENHKIEYYAVPGRGHCDLTPEMRQLYLDKMVKFIFDNVANKNSYNVLIAMDSFKGSLSSVEAGNAVKEALITLYQNINAKVFPFADGGEGTVNALQTALGGRTERATVTGPLGEPVTAEYCLLNDNNTAIIEIAAIAGISLVPKENLNPLDATSYGVGELIKVALGKGCRKFIVGLGGSATNDGGAGMLQALGFGLLDKDGKDIPRGAKGLERLCKITPCSAIKELDEASFLLACDVSNPLCGEEGCSAVFAPQKGASKESIAVMDKWLENFAAISESVSDKSDKNATGAGAAGGLGFAFMTFTNSSFESGCNIILRETGIEKYIKTADFIITGEGKIDRQTIMGKAPVVIAKLAKKHNKKTIAFCGCIGEGAELCNKYGIDAFFPIVRNACSSEEAMNPENAYQNLKNTAYQVFRFLGI